MASAGKYPPPPCKSSYPCTSTRTTSLTVDVEDGSEDEAIENNKAIPGRPVLKIPFDGMAAQNARSERVYHQDYIARIRYNNSLPPPPGAPKLLNIPTDGLAYYTSAAFASRMARQQALNIEADAELGMPIDLVGMPGIFDGDESCEC